MGEKKSYVSEIEFLVKDSEDLEKAKKILSKSPIVIKIKPELHEYKSMAKLTDRGALQIFPQSGEITSVEIDGREKELTFNNFLVDFKNKTIILSKKEDRNITKVEIQIFSKPFQP